MQSLNYSNTIGALIDNAAQQYGNNTFLIEGEQAYDYIALQEQCRRVAKALLATGVKPGERVAIWAPNMTEWVFAALGAQYIGVILVPLNTRYKGSEAAFTLNESQAKVLFCVGDFLGSNYPQMLDGQNLQHLQQCVVFNQSSVATTIEQTSWQQFLTLANAISDAELSQHRQAVCGDDIADILFTSGTTGKPKGVLTTQQQNIQTFSHWSSLLGLSVGEKYLVISPFFHSFGYKAGVLAAIIKGAVLLPQQTFDAAEILTRIAQEGIEVMPGPPTLFQSLLTHPDLSSYDISSLKRTTTGAAIIPVELIQKMKQTLGFDVVLTAYGLTECAVVTMCRATDDNHIIAKTSGRAIDGVQVRSVDSNGKDVAVGKAGEIIVKGFNVMQGYFNNGKLNIEATNATIDNDGWLHTGDIGTLDEQGNLSITDRIKDMYITGGFNCYPAEIENMISTHADIASCAVIGIDEPRLGEVGMAFVVLSADKELNEKELINWCRNNMANYKVPRKVLFIDVLPLNASGKVLKTELKSLAETISQG